LVLLGLLARGLHEGKANAQRVQFADQEPPREAAPAVSPPAFFSANEFSPDEPTLGPPSVRSQPARFDSQPHRGLSTPSTQPIVIAIKDGPQLKGDTVDLAAFKFKTIFGQISIPVNTIAGLRMADDPRQPATICLSNGDSLTGVLATDSVTIKTAWGGATVGRDHIVSIVTTSEPVTWQQHEGRWRIAVGEAVEKSVGGEPEEVDRYETEAANEAPQFDSTSPLPSAASRPFQLLPDSGRDSDSDGAAASP
jgi:hypothetical protein